MFWRRMSRTVSVTRLLDQELVLPGMPLGPGMSLRPGVFFCPPLGVVSDDVPDILISCVA
jgi:hypothetical protein